MKLIILTVFIIAAVQISWCSTYLSGTFTRIVPGKNATDTVKGAFYYNQKKETVLLEVSYPVHQYFFSTADKFLIYYPESNTGFRYSGEMGEGTIDFMSNFFGAINDKLGIRSNSIQLLSRQELGDTVHYSFQSKDRNKSGPLFSLELKKTSLQGRERFARVILKDQKGSPAAQSRFTDYLCIQNICYPKYSYLKKYSEKESVLIIKELEINSIWPEGYQNYRIPKTCKIQDF
jgi:hypothetical protein